MRPNKGYTRDCVNVKVDKAFRNKLKAIASDNGMKLTEFTRKLGRNSDYMNKTLEKIKNRKGGFRFEPF